MVASAASPAPTHLIANRNRVVAKSFYRQLVTEGFSHEQIIDLSATLLDLVTDDMQREPRTQD
ncbi:MAG: hypothetical protein KC912_20245 [Proteobacteria bacterium]|nr:hypothetical protein [Pseudomonadota bacterium]